MRVTDVLCLSFLIILAESQKLSYERMLQFFEGTSATESDAEHLAQHVDQYALARDKPGAAAEWIQSNFGNEPVSFFATFIPSKIADFSTQKEKVGEIAEKVKEFIGNLTFAYDYMTNGAHQTLKEAHLIDEAIFEELHKDFTIKQAEYYRNDLLHADAAFTADLMDAMNYNVKDLIAAQELEKQFVTPELNATLVNLLNPSTYKFIDISKNQRVKSYFYSMMIWDIKKQYKL